MLLFFTFGSVIRHILFLLTSQCLVTAEPSSVLGNRMLFKIVLEETRQVKMVTLSFVSRNL